jgi:hypothetical protein
MDEVFPGVRLYIRASSRGGIAAEQIGLFLFDFSVAFDLFRRYVEHGGKDRLTQWDLYRGHRRVSPIERVSIDRIRMESPLEIVATAIALSVGGATAVLTAVQAMERIYMLRVNRAKAELEVRKLEREVRQLESGDSGPRQLARIADEMPRNPVDRVEELESPRPSKESAMKGAALLEQVVRGPDEIRRPRSDHHDENRRVLETVQRRLLRNPVQIDQLELEFDPRISPPAG